jgi:glutamine synthetase
VVKAAGGTAREPKKLLDKLSKIVDEAKSGVDQLQDLLEHDHEGSAAKHAKYFRDKVIPTMTALREAGDALECLVPQNVWPLPTYREMLFIK